MQDIGIPDQVVRKIDRESTQVCQSEELPRSQPFTFRLCTTKNLKLPLATCVSTPYLEDRDL